MQKHAIAHEIIADEVIEAERKYYRRGVDPWILEEFAKLLTYKGKPMSLLGISSIDSTKSDRVKFFVFNAKRLPEILNGRVSVVRGNMPKDAEVIRTWFDPMMNQFGVMICSMEFPEIKEYALGKEQPKFLDIYHHQEQPKITPDTTLRELAKIASPMFLT